MLYPPTAGAGIQAEPSVVRLHMMIPGQWRKEFSPKTCSFSGWHIPVHTHTRGNHLPLPHECESPNLNGGRLTNQGGTGVATTTTSGVVVAIHDRTSDS